jgi:hypothetical protein
MNFRTTAILAGVLLVAVAALLIKSLFSTVEPPKDTVARAILDLPADDSIAHVTIQAASGEAFEIEKADKGWKIKQPLVASAEDWQCNDLVSDLTKLKSRSVDISGDNLKATGLDKPRFTINLQSKQGKKWKLDIGKKSPVGTDLYVRVNDGKDGESVSGTELADRLNKGIDELVSSLRSKSMVSMSADDVKQVTVARQDLKLVAHKTDGKWNVVSPQRMPGDNSEIMDVVRKITGLYARDFVAPGTIDPRFTGLTSPPIRVTLTTAPATRPAATAATAPADPSGTVTVDLGFPADMKKTKAYAGLAGTVAKIDQDVVDFFNKLKPLDLRDREILDIKPEEVSKVEIATHLRATTQPTTRSESKEKVAFERKPEEPKVMGPPVPTVRPSTTQASTGPATTMAVATQAATTATAPAVESPPSKWKLLPPKKGDADESKVDTLLKALNPLKVSKYIEPSSATTKPVASYTLTIHTQKAGGAGSAVHQLELTDPGDNKPLIGALGELRFEIDRDIAGKLEGDWTNRPKTNP